jgi:uncharacterized protein
MGILLLNIVDLAMPGHAYSDPTYYGGADAVNLATWALNYALFDGKMRGLFVMMFGASTVLIAERAAQSDGNPARAHYTRMFWLLVFGLIHAFLIWYGDILVLYSLCGALAYVAWRWTPRTLIGLGVTLLAVKLVVGLFAYSHAPLVPPIPQSADSLLAAFRGSYLDALATRFSIAWYIVTDVHPFAVPDTLGLLLIGMALYKLGFFSGAWSRQSYRRVALLGYAICLPLYAPLIYWNIATEFSPLTYKATEAIHLTLLRPWLTLAHASAVILFFQSGYARELSERIEAAGRMALSNYVGTSIVCTLFFNGYGLGWYGHLERWQCYLVVPVVWALILLWSKPWLEYFAYGPLEWLWRSLARGERQPFVRDFSPRTLQA